MLLKRCLLLIPLFVLAWTGRLLGQAEEIELNVFGFEEGLSHRNVYKIQQDSLGFIWMATVKGLNRYDGYHFQQYTTFSKKHPIPHHYIYDMVVGPDSHLWMSVADHLMILDPVSGETELVRINERESIARQAKIAHNLFWDGQQQLWMAMYDEKSAETEIQLLKPDRSLFSALKTPGKYVKRPLTGQGKKLFAAVFGNELWEIDPDGTVFQKETLPLSNQSFSRITQIQSGPEGTLWVLTNEGALFFRQAGQSTFQRHHLSNKLDKNSATGALFVEDNGNIWVGGTGALWYLEAASGKLKNLNDRVVQITKNTCTYRQIFKDKSGVIWVATDFGAVKINRIDRLFDTYLNGGKEFCSNGFCSMRGITEDEKGNIYLAYYNSIHKLDPESGSLQPLFPQNDYFNLPFGLLYHQDALFTGNGLRIDLKSLRIDTLFKRPSIDLGAPLLDNDGSIWLGYRKWLYHYFPSTGKLDLFTDPNGVFDTTKFDISHLHLGQKSDAIWISTLSNGLLRMDRQKGITAHYTSKSQQKSKLSHSRVNAVYEDANGIVWIASGNGLCKLYPGKDSTAVYRPEDGLPHRFINGLLSEGDSCLWITTDNGLSRFDIKSETFLNFNAEDGITANEFNRISFHKAKNGRMYFGGLNGVNAFFPGKKFLKENRKNKTGILLTNFSRYDSGLDTLITFQPNARQPKPISLSFRDKTFTFDFALSDFKDPNENLFSYMLEGFEKNWSTPSIVHFARYQNIPAGHYTFRVKGSPGRDNWDAKPLSVQIHIKEAFYQTWWFVGLSALALLGIIYGIFQYRIYRIQKHERELEKQVQARTIELEKEKQKSDELLLNILPVDIAEELKNTGSAKAKRHDMVTVLFADFQGFTAISEKLEPEDLVAEIDLSFRAFDVIIEKYGLEKIKTIGDAYMCAGGISSNGTDSATQVVKAALEMQEAMHDIAEEKKKTDGIFFEARIGIHSGPVVAGIVGIKKFAFDIWGDTVNIAARMETNGKVGKVNISESTYHLIRDHYSCIYRGKIIAKNKGEIDMYFVGEEKSPRRSD